MYLPSEVGERLLKANLEYSATYLPLSTVDFKVQFNIELVAYKLNAKQERDIN